MKNRISLLLLLVFSTFLLSSTSVQAQCVLVCHNDITVALDTAGEASVYPPMLLHSSVNCSNNYEITIVDTLGNDVGTLLDGSHIGMPLLATLLHPASGNSCDVEIEVIDAMAPKIVGADTAYIWCNWPLDSLETPVVSDNVTPADSILFSYTDTLIDLGCYEEVNGNTVTAYLERMWYAEDESGNMDSCLQMIYLKRATLSQIVFPDHRDGVEEPALECGADDPYDLNIAGQPTVEGFPVDIAGSCELVVSHSDQQVPICGGARKLIRTWTVFDLCTEDFLVYAQIIRMEDNTPPTVTCPANVSFNTFSSSCTAQVYLPQGSVTDDCSGAILSPSWSYGNGYGPFNDVPAGVHTVTYTAQDGCSNTSSCQITVTVKDTKKPTALCELQVQVSLEEDGTALVFAETFDNGSYDNCAIAEYLVTFTGDNNYDTFVSFYCSDLNTTPNVTLKVVDENGLEASCSGSVIVKDQIKPEIICPAAVNINCGSDYNNTSVTGVPYATDNCGTATTSKIDFVNLNNCGNGTVERTWKATDQSGNIATCMQLITITDNTDIVVVFPDDVDLYDCQPDLEPSLMGEPVVTGQDCEQLQITHTDYYFYTAEPSCFQLIRNWAIVDWCSYSPNNPSAGGFWEHTQVIEVRDSMPPVLSCPDMPVIGIDDNGCSTFVNVPLPSVDDCSTQLTITNDSEHSQSNMGAASGVYPKGNYVVTYTVSDGCGNTATCSTQITVVDSETPNPVCNNGVSVTIQQTGYVTLTPAMINNGSYDNCSPTNTLILQVSPNTFTCQDLGTKVVTLTVTDQSGNSAFCQTNVVVQDNLDVCGNGTVATIAGKLETEAGEALGQKLVGLTGGINMAVHTDVDGTFDFPSLPLNQSYTLTPVYDTKPLNGVTTYDMVIIRKHILGIEALPSPYKIIAADANASGSVTTYDLVILQKLILNVIDEFPGGNKSWRFVDAKYVFPNPANPFSQPFPETITINPLTSNKWGQDFVGIKVGDVNDSANPANVGGDETDDRGFENALIFKSKDIELVAGQVYAIPFVAAPSQPLAGFQFTLYYDENYIEFQGYEAGSLPGLKGNNFGSRYADEGMVAMNWENVVSFQPIDGEALFALEFSVKNNTRLSDVLTLNSKLIPAEAYFGETVELDLAGVSLEFEQDDNGQEALQFFQNTPNPFFRTTDLHFFLPEATTVSIRIFDVYGQLIKTYTQFFTQGHQTFPIDLGGLSANGVLICELNADGFRKQTIKMVNSD